MTEATPPRYRIVGTAGHIDHGKSALVKALTGTDPDRLQEEKERGITIDLGFADLQIDDLRVGLIDVPGHERFVKNMLAGIGGIDAVILVVAADESIMPQTREHFAICRLLGIDHGVVALTKRDLVDEELLDLAEMETREFLAGTPLEDAAIVHTSALDGDGIDELRVALKECLEVTDERPAAGVLRLPVDRVFTVKGFGTVITGTILSGSVKVGESVQLQPSGAVVTVRGAQVHGSETTVAHAGQRTALNLQGVQVSQLARGMIIGHPDTLAPSHLIDARLEILSDYPKLEHLQRVRFHHGAAEILARVAVLEGTHIEGGSGAYVQLRLESPYPAAPGDRFIIRRYSPVTTIGGGQVIDGAPTKHRSGQQIVAALHQLEGGTEAERLAQWVHAAGIGGMDRLELQLRLVRPASTIDSLLQHAETDGTLAILPGSRPRAVSRRDLDRLESELEATIRDYHARYPLRPAAPKEDLRSAIVGNPPSEVVDAALSEIVVSGRVRAAADGYALATHLVRLPPSTAATRDLIMAKYESAGLAPPSPDQAIASAGPDAEHTREVFHHLLRQGELVRVREDLVVHGEALQKLVDSLQAHFPRGAQFSVADFKEWAGVTRKHAIPLLEYLDTRHITRRVGDARERM